MAGREIRWEDLPAAIRHRIHDSRQTERRKAEPSQPGQKRWQCVACGEIHKSWAAAERHADDEGHRRIELILEENRD